MNRPKQLQTESVLAKQKVFWQNRKCFGKTETVLPKLFCAMALKIQSNLYSHSIYELSVHILT